MHEAAVATWDILFTFFLTQRYKISLSEANTCPQWLSIMAEHKFKFPQIFSAELVQA